MGKRWIVLAGFISLLPPAAQAQDLPSEGKFSITYTAVTPSPNKPIALGKDRDIIMNAAIMTAVNDAGSGLLHNMAGRCFVLNTIDKAAKTLESKGYCVYADRAGDQVFEEFAMPAPIALGSPAKYMGTWTGGTGKFAGLSGTFDIAASGNIGPEGVGQVAGRKTGSYKIVK
jgi:hypothetical protein